MSTGSSGRATAIDTRRLFSAHLGNAVVLVRSLRLDEVIGVLVADSSVLGVVAGTVVNGPVQVCRSGMRRQSVVVGIVGGALVASRHHAAEKTRLLLVLLVDSAGAVARSVAVARGGAETLLLAVVAGEGELSEEGKDEEENGDDGNGETCRLELACCAEAGERCEATRAFIRCLGRLTTTEGSVKVAVAAAGAVLVGNSNIDESPDEGEINGHGQESSHGTTGETPEKEESDEGVEDSSSSNTLNSTQSGADTEIVVVKGGQEVRVDTKDQSSAKELHTANEPLKELEAKADLLAHDDGC